MGPGSAPPRTARLRRWLGWNRDVATVAIGLDDDVASVLCLRRRAVITASGRVGLPPGTVRNGRLLLSGTVDQTFAPGTTVVEPAAPGAAAAMVGLRAAAGGAVDRQPAELARDLTVASSRTIGTVLPVGRGPAEDPVWS